MGRIDAVCGVNQAATGGLLDGAIKEIIYHQFNIGKKSINNISLGQFLEAIEQPSQCISEVSRD